MKILNETQYKELLNRLPEKPNEGVLKRELSLIMMDGASADNVETTHFFIRALEEKYQGKENPEVESALEEARRRLWKNSEYLTWDQKKLKELNSRLDERLEIVDTLIDSFPKVKRMTISNAIFLLVRLTRTEEQKKRVKAIYDGYMEGTPVAP